MTLRSCLIFYPPLVTFTPFLNQAHQPLRFHCRCFIFIFKLARTTYRYSKMEEDFLRLDRNNWWHSHHDFCSFRPGKRRINNILAPRESFQHRQHQKDSIRDQQFLFLGNRSGMGERDWLAIEMTFCSYFLSNAERYFHFKVDR